MWLLCAVCLIANSLVSCLLPLHLLLAARVVVVHFYLLLLRVQFN